MSDLRETLDQLDRRLNDLRHKIAALAEEPRAAAASAPAPGPVARGPESPASAPDPASPGPEPSSLAPEPWLPSAPAGRSPEGARPKGLDVLFGKAAPQPPAPQPPAPQAPEPEPAAEPQASEPEPAPEPQAPEPEPASALRPAPAGSETGLLSGQIQELIDLRDRLLADSRELVRTYEEKLDTLEQLAAAGLPAGAASAPGADESHPVAARAGDRQPGLFEGTVTLVVSGVHRLQTVEVLEDALGRAREVEDVYIRRCFQGQVWLELTLSSDVELVDELGRVLPFRFEVTSAAGNQIALALEEGP